MNKSLMVLSALTVATLATSGLTATASAASKPTCYKSNYNTNKSFCSTDLRRTRYIRPPRRPTIPILPPPQQRPPVVFNFANGPVDDGPEGGGGGNGGGNGRK